jgi:ribonuclease D
MTDFCYINTDSELSKVIDLIRQAKIAALDTEFHRETTYYPILSLVQIAVDDKIFLVDCMQGLDLSGLFAVIADEKIIKILHSCAQDLQIFYYYSNLFPKNIFDTQIMGNFCDFGFNVGYSEIVEKLFLEKLDKDQQRSDWRRRPLSSKQVEYAALDVVFLERIYRIFLEKLSQKNRVNWLLEEMNSTISKILLRKDEAIYKEFTNRNKTAIEFSQIKLMALLREKWAQKIDVPRRHLLKDEEVEKIVRDGFCDFNLDKEMLAEISNILDCKEEIIKPLPNLYMNEGQKKAFLEAKSLISKIATRENIKEQFLLTTLDLKAIICKKNSFEKVITGWRHELFAEELKPIINL